MPDVYKRIGGLFALLASADDKQVGRALDQLDAALAEAGLTWAQLGAKVSTLGTSSPAAATPDPRRTLNGAARPPSQWKLDREDVVRLHEAAMAGDLDQWTTDFATSLHEWVVGQGRGISARQREILIEKLDQNGL